VPQAAIVNALDARGNQTNGVRPFKNMPSFQSPSQKRDDAAPKKGGASRAPHSENTTAF
jgi:hypothetical protein